MNENLPQNYKESFLKKFWNKIKAFFSKSKPETDEILTENNVNQIRHEEDYFTNQIKVEDSELNNEYERKQFMQKLTDNPELLENFSVERLEKILEYYKNENEQKRKIIANYA